jgi:hypothetical protein
VNTLRRHYPVLSRYFRSDQRSRLSIFRRALRPLRRETVKDGTKRGRSWTEPFFESSEIAIVPLSMRKVNEKSRKSRGQATTLRRSVSWVTGYLRSCPNTRFPDSIETRRLSPTFANMEEQLRKGLCHFHRPFRAGEFGGTFTQGCAAAPPWAIFRRRLCGWERIPVKKGVKTSGISTDSVGVRHPKTHRHQNASASGRSRKESTFPRAHCWAFFRVSCAQLAARADSPVRSARAAHPGKGAPPS